MNYKLSIELVPKPLWHRNVRYSLGKYKWGKFRKDKLIKLPLVCSVCRFIPSSSKNISLHEEWAYEVSCHPPIARLVNFKLVCWNCHAVEHFGLTLRLTASGRYQEGTVERLIQHWMTVNGATEAAFHQHVREVAEEHNRLSELRDWQMDWGPMAKNPKHILEGEAPLPP